ncbi:Uncharacterized protein APZ42_031122 [Daphnia magna]|uniref:HTH psq-type domain-containing protein n=1 Tax=Daphnia magna TaxID=35525 RepID=A0A164N4S3_9CRUS|nr:Uncharacterized protein APZ42_031122 [Daphnia magna]
MERLFCIAKIVLLSRGGKKKVSGLTLLNPPYNDFAPNPPYLSLKRILYVSGDGSYRSIASMFGIPKTTLSRKVLLIQISMLFKKVP